MLYIAAYNRILSYKLRSSSKETAPVVKDLTCVQNLGIVLKHINKLVNGVFHLQYKFNSFLYIRIEIIYDILFIHNLQILTLALLCSIQVNIFIKLLPTHGKISNKPWTAINYFIRKFNILNENIILNIFCWRLSYQQSILIEFFFLTDVDGKHLYWTDSKSMAVYMYDLESHHKPWNIVDTGNLQIIFLFTLADFKILWESYRFFDLTVKTCDFCHMSCSHDDQDFTEKFSKESICFSDLFFQSYCPLLEKGGRHRLVFRPPTY